MTAQVLQQIGRYRVAAKLGSGGMGIVYRAYDEKLRRDVAIKLLHREPDDSGRERILHEARTSSALNHPGICTVYEVERSRRSVVHRDGAGGGPAAQRPHPT